MTITRAARKRINARWRNDRECERLAERIMAAYDPAWSDCDIALMSDNRRAPHDLKQLNGKVRP